MDLLERLGLEPTQQNKEAVKRWHLAHLKSLATDYNGYIASRLTDTGTTALNLCAIAGVPPYTLYYWRKSMPQQIVNAINIERALLSLDVEGRG